MNGSRSNICLAFLHVVFSVKNWINMYFLMYLQVFIDVNKGTDFLAFFNNGLRLVKTFFVT